MVARSRYVDYKEDGGISLKFGLLSEDSVAAFLFSYFAGFIDLVTRWGYGTNSAIDGLASWAYGRDGLIASLFGIGIDAVDVALASNAAFVASFGPLSIIVAGVEIIVLGAILIETIIWAFKRVRRALG